MSHADLTDVYDTEGLLGHSPNHISESEHEVIDHVGIVDVQRDRFPFSIVWTPLPLLTWLFPFIGHLGIARSDGLVHDFAGPYYIHKSHRGLAFGPVTKFYQINANDINAPLSQWDPAIEDASESFSHLIHNILMNNCHHHVAQALNRLQFKGRSDWDTTKLIIFMIFNSKYSTIPRMISVFILYIIGLLVLFIYFIIQLVD